MKKIIIYGDNEYALYHPLSAVESAFKNIFSDFNVEVTDVEEHFLDLLEVGCDAVILYVDRFERPLLVETNKALLNYIKRGGKLLIIHNGISLALDPELFEVIGAKFTGHPPYQNLQIKRNKDHILLKGIHDFSIDEEPYQFEIKNDLGQILLSYQLEDKCCPAYWVKDYGDGEVFYLMFGHNLKSFEHVSMIKLLKNFIAYV